MVPDIVPMPPSIQLSPEKRPIDMFNLNLDLQSDDVLKSQLEERILSNRSLLNAMKSHRGEDASNEAAVIEGKSSGLEDTTQLISQLVNGYKRQLGEAATQNHPTGRSDLMTIVQNFNMQN